MRGGRSWVITFPNGSENGAGQATILTTEADLELGGFRRAFWPLHVSTETQKLIANSRRAMVTPTILRIWRAAPDNEPFEYGREVYLALERSGNGSGILKIEWRIRHFHYRLE
jgi:hypothetical protein